MFYRSAGILNLAHGSLVMLAGMVLTSVMPSLPAWIALPLGVALGVTFSVLLFVLFVRPVLARGPWFLMFVTLGVSFIAVGAAQIIWGTNSHGFEPAVEGQVNILGAVLRYQQLLGLFLAFVVTAFVAWHLRHTMLGRAIRAAAEEPDGAATVGIDAKRMMLIAALSTGGLAGLGAALIVPDIGVEPQTANFLTLIAVTAAVIGGLGSIWGAVAGGMTLGIFNGLSSGLAPRWFEVIEFSLLLLVLVYRAAVLARHRSSSPGNLTTIIRSLLHRPARALPPSNDREEAGDVARVN